MKKVAAKLRKAATLLKKATSSSSNLKLLTRPAVVRNKILQQWDTVRRNPSPRSFPSNITFSLTNVCNMSCPFCSINNLKEKLTRVVNNITLEEIKKFDSLLKTATRLSFMGFNGEAIVNPEFADIISYLKENYHLFLHTSTNGNGLNAAIQDKMLAVGFDSITFSIHAFTPDTYKILQNGNLDLAKGNLTRLLAEKKRLGKRVPYTTVVFALNRTNIDEAKAMLNWVSEIGVDSFYIYHYHDYTNRLQSLAFTAEEYEAVNKKIDELYDYAHSRKIDGLLPVNRPYFRSPVLKEEGEEVKCRLPWKELQMRSSFSNQDCYYLGCCNTFNAFLFNYKEHIAKYGRVEFEKIWNHPVFQYLRATVNSDANHTRNPLCRYCQSAEREYFKNTDKRKNYEHKLRALDEFFEGFRQFYPNPEEVAGLKILFAEDEELMANVF